MTVTENIVRHVGETDVPWVQAGEGVELQVVRVDSQAGIWVIRNRFAPGVVVQRHRHTGPVDGFTISGRWHYREYDFYSTAGSYIREPAGSVHTLEVPADNTEPTDVLFVIEGANLNLREDGSVESVIDADSILAAYRALCEAAGVEFPEHIVTG